MQTYLILAIPILFATAWLYTAQVAQSSFPRLRGKRICILIAHPDDEAMFFNPTLIALNDKELGNHVKVLCLSNGNADGLGEIRKNELIRSTSMLGLRSLDDVLIVEDDAFPDSMTATWAASKVANLLTFTFASKEALAHARLVGQVKKPKKGDREPVATIDVLITFDRTGVSSHPNHISLYHGSVAWLKGLMKGKSGWECPVTLYTLTSTNILRKYLSVLDVPFTVLSTVLQGMRSAGTKRSASDLPERLVYVNSIGDYRRGQTTMTTAHSSQMRWFRWGWVLVSRYMVVNDLQKVKIL